MPSDNLSEYSKGGLLRAPDDGSLNGGTGDPTAEAPGNGLVEGVPGDGAAADGVLAEGSPPLSTLDGTSSQAPGGQAPNPILSQDLDAGPVPVAEPTGDTTASAADAGAVSRCAPGATVGPGAGSTSRCFALLTTPSSWADARAACQDKGRGWDLTTIHSGDRNRFLASFLGTLSDAWVGASDTDSEGVWRWLGDSAAFWNGNGATGSAVGNAFVSWTAGTNPEPNGGDLSDCLRLRAGGGWADLQCTTLFAAICEGPTL